MKPVFTFFLIVLVTVGLFCSKRKQKDPLKDQATQNEVVIETRLGNIVFQFLPELAPKTVENFKKLANSEFYNGTTFHRVIPDFMIQGGDPNSKDGNRSNDGMGGPGYNIKAEFSSEKHMRGVVSMARSADPDSAGSQFFVVVKDSPWLDGKYTIFGRVKEGIDVVDKISLVSRDSHDNPLDKIEIQKVYLR